MMELRNALATSAAAIALAAGSTAQAGDYYVSVFGGLSTFDDEVPFAATTSNSANLGSAYVSRTTLAGGKITTAISTAFPKWGYCGSASCGTAGISDSYIFTGFSSFTFSATVGFYKVVGSRFDAFSQVQSSKFSWEDDFDSGFVVGAAFGNQINDTWRAELELAYRQADVSGGAKFSRRIDGTLYQAISFPYATNYIYRYIKSASVSKTTSIGPTYVNQVYGGTGYYVTSLPIDNGSATGYIKAATLTGYGPIPYKTIAFPVNGTTTGNASSGGDAQVWSLMANIWYDFNFMGLNPDGMHTFIGGGVGVAQLDLEYNATAGTYFGGTVGYGLDDGGMGFAYQLGGGIGFDLGDGMMLSAQYRWFGTSDIDLGNTDMRVESHNALISLSVPIGNLGM